MPKCVVAKKLLKGIKVTGVGIDKRLINQAQLNYPIREAVKQRKI